MDRWMRMHLPWRRAMTVAVATGVAVPLLGQLVPPFHVLTHEFTQLFTVVAAAVSFFLAAHLAGGAARERGVSAPARMSAALTVAVTAAGVMGLLAFLVMLAANALGPHCRVADGALFYWVTWPPAVALTAVLGVVLGEQRWRWPWLLAVLGGLALVSLLHDGLQAMWGPQIVDLFVGKPVAFDVRAPMDIPRVHGLQRVLVTALAVTVWNLSLWRHGRAVRGAEAEAVAHTARNRGLLGVVALVLVVGAAGSHVGVGWGRGALRGELSGVVRTEHFVVRYAPGDMAEVHAEAVALDAEWYRHLLTSRWGLEPDQVIEINLFDGRRQQSAFTLTRSAHVVNDTISLTWRSALGPTLEHELVHALHYGLAGAEMAILPRGILEGLAHAYEKEYALEAQAHEELAAALQGETLPSAVQVMSSTGFWTLDEGNAYDAAGSFVGFLVLEYGFASFYELQETRDYEGIYGCDLAELDRRWRSFLAEVPVDLEEMAAAREAFDPALQPAYSDECCPKLGTHVTELDDEATRRWSAGDPTGALAIYEQLYREEPEPRWAYQAVQCLRRLEREQEALALADEVLADGELPEDERFRFLQVRANCLLTLGQRDAMLQALDALDALEPPRRERAVLQACLRDPELGPQVAAALAWNHSPYQRRRTMEDLLARYPDDDRLRHAYVTWIYRVPTGQRQLGIERQTVRRVDHVLAQVQVVPALADDVADHLVGVAHQAARAGDVALADRICTTLERHVTEPLEQLHLCECRQRLAWQAGRSD